MFPDALEEITRGRDAGETLAGGFASRRSQSILMLPSLSTFDHFAMSPCGCARARGIRSRYLPVRSVREVVALETDKWERVVRSANLFHSQ